MKFIKFIFQCHLKAYFIGSEMEYFEKNNLINQKLMQDIAFIACDQNC